MKTHQGVRVNSLTTGTPSHKFEEFRIDYVYGGSKTDDDDDAPVSASGAESSAARKRRRMAKLTELQKIDPPLSLAEKARRMNLAPKTVRRYIKELDKAAREAAS